MRAVPRFTCPRCGFTLPMFVEVTSCPVCLTAERTPTGCRCAAGAVRLRRYFGQWACAACGRIEAQPGSEPPTRPEAAAIAQQPTLRERISELIRLHPNESNRALARLANSSHHTVKQVRLAMAAGELSEAA